jgi:hypothetical protein
MKITWLCFWVAFAAVEVGLTIWSHSSIFLEIGAVVPVMIAYNAPLVRRSRPTSSQVQVRTVRSRRTAVLG